MSQQDGTSKRTRKSDPVRIKQADIDRMDRPVTLNQTVRVCPVSAGEFFSTPFRICGPVVLMRAAHY